MALSITQTAALVGIIENGMHIASMGYPDLIARIDDVPGLKYRADSSAICRRHGLKQRLIPDAHSYFELQGCTLDVYDIVQERGSEILCDLNKPIEAIAPFGTYDIVLDVGTVEHCFNIAQAVMNMAGMVKEGGYILHENPFCMGNHGFYGLNPTFYADFYAANGFKLLECRLVTRDGREAIVPHTQRFKFAGEEANVFAMAQRLEIKPMVYPMQSKYAKAPAAGENRAKEIAHG